MSKENYNKLLRDNITKTYKKTNTSIKDNIDKETANIAKSFHIQNRVECYANRNTFLTLKDQKENFRSNTKCRLLNRSKSEIGLIHL